MVRRPGSNAQTVVRPKRFSSNAVTSRHASPGRLLESLLHGNALGRQRSGTARLGGFDAWSTFADVQRPGDQKDHVLMPRHSQVPRGEALVIDVAGAIVRALQDDGTYAEGVSRPLKNGVVEVAVGEIVGPGLRLYLCR